MTAPHWTVDDDGSIWFETSSEALEPWEALPATSYEQMQSPRFEAAYDALVAAVRDATTLAHARQLAVKVRNTPNPTYLNALSDLLDLLLTEDDT